VQTQTTIRVRDLEHVQSLAHSDLLNGHGSNSINDPPLQQLKFDISGMPICDIIEMVAALLTKITSTNDLQHDALNRNAHHLRQAQAQARASADGSGDASSMSPLSSSVLAFHGKNVPAITILSYLTRIHKYCPTTFEVFLSLLVYFDRMTERVNDLVMKSEEERRRKLQEQLRQQAQQAKREETQRLKRQSRTAAERAEGEAAKDGEDTIMRDRDDEQDQQEEEMDDASSNATETDSDLADSTDDGDEGTEATDATAATKSAAAGSSPHATYFVVDSFNIHRLIIAGVTCASKFFSDVFYTNSRYAKVRLLSLSFLHLLPIFVTPRSFLSNYYYITIIPIIEFYLLTSFTLARTGRRSPPPRTQSPRVAVPAPQRLPARRPRRGPRGVRDHVGRVLCPRGRRAVVGGEEEDETCSLIGFG
jgi:hypothetical protein